MIDYKIVNIVAYTQIDENLNLNKIHLSLSNCEYEPDLYFALIYRLTKPKLSILVNSSGKIIFTGAISIDDIKKARETFFNDLISIGYTPKKKEISFQNIVIVSQLKQKPIFQKILVAKENSEYNSETFPGLIYRSLLPKFTASIFATGKLTITGLKKFNDIQPALSIVNKIVNDI